VAHFSGKMIMTPHSKFGFILLLILFLCLLIFVAVRFRLNKWIGITFLIMYIIFLVYAFIQELYCARQLGIYC
jgi:Ca2+/Na+ antiporter